MRDHEFAKLLRREMTFPERLLWGRLRNRRTNGLRFRRQHPIGPYIADFACIERRLIVEVDGRSHGDRRRDRPRDRVLEAMGWRVLRIGNDEVVTRLGEVMASIVMAADGHVRVNPFRD